MSKSNVHLDHYKVAGRDRQGEDILQARHKQKRAQMLARERFEPRLTTPPPAGPARASKPPVEEVPAAKPSGRKKATPTRGAKKAAVKKTGKTGARQASARKPSVRRRTAAK